MHLCTCTKTCILYINGTGIMDTNGPRLEEEEDPGSSSVVSRFRIKTVQPNPAYIQMYNNTCMHCLF